MYLTFWINTNVSIWSKRSHQKLDGQSSEQGGQFHQYTKVGRRFQCLRKKKIRLTEKINMQVEAFTQFKWMEYIHTTVNLVYHSTEFPVVVNWKTPIHDFDIYKTTRQTHWRTLFREMGGGYRGTVGVTWRP